MISGEQDEFDVMYEYEWLFTQEERREAKKRRLATAVKIKNPVQEGDVNGINNDI